MNRIFLYVVTSLVAFSFCTAFLGHTPTVYPKIDQDLLLAFEQSDRVSFLVLFHEQADLSKAKQKKTKEEKGQYVFHRLKTTATQAQQSVRTYLDREGITHRPFYIINAIQVVGSLTEAETIAAFPEVALLTTNPLIRQELPKTEESNWNRFLDSIEWGIQRIEADSVWKLGYKGQGVVIGGQDTGYDWSHPAITSRYRGNGTVLTHDYNWHDAIHEAFDTLGNPCGYALSAPCDDSSHGTHTMGTMVGEDGMNKIGVAPEAQWIGCRNMDKGNGTPTTYIECFEWFLAPYDINGNNPNPDLAPHVINNSWSCPVNEGCNTGNFGMMQLAVDNLRAAGVVVVVSAGNNGPDCFSINRPAAIFESSFSVGATRQDDTITNWSSRGPVTVDSSFRLKPDVAAPGSQVRSAVLNGNYGIKSGTSMAGPHVAGTVALMISANPSLAGEVELIEEILKQTAKPMLHAQDCGDFPGNTIPNSVYGHGRINALAAVEMAITYSNIKTPEYVEIPFDLFPNPARNQTTLRWRGTDALERYQITDRLGRLVAEWDGQLLKYTSLSIPLNQLSAGVYFIQLQTNQNQKYSRKFVVY